VGSARNTGIAALWRDPVLAVLLALLIAPGCKREPPARPGEPVTAVVEGRREITIGPRTTNVLGNPTKVRGYRILSPFAPNFEELEKTRPLIDGYPVLAEAPVRMDTARKIAAILLDPDSYDRAYEMDCVFEPGYALRFERGSDVVDVIICFKCSDLDIVPAKSLREKTATQPFGRVAKSLYGVVSEVFPEQGDG
jgi:hypothetical protein